MGIQFTRENCYQWWWFCVRQRWVYQQWYDLQRHPSYHGKRHDSSESLSCGFFHAFLAPKSDSPSDSWWWI